MATVVTKIIGTGGDYETLAAWIAACPTNLVTADQVWQGKCKNQVFSGSGTMLTVSGITTDATRYVELTTDDGASFLDNPNVRTNALRYNEANGAAIKTTGLYNATISVGGSIFKISKLQITNTAPTSTPGITIANTGSGKIDINQCIVEGNHGTAGVINLNNSGGMVRNSLVVLRATSASLIAKITNGSGAYNCVFASIASTATNGFSAEYAGSTLKNCYLGGAAAVSIATTYTKTTCFTDISGPPSGWSSAPFSTATFENITDGTHDFRLKAGSSLIDAGTTDSTYAANDITGLARAGSWDVGAWESATAGGTSSTFAATTEDSTFSFNAKSGALVSFNTTSADVVFAGWANTGSAAATFAATTSDSAFTGAAVGDTSSGVITTPVLKNNTGTILTNETGITAYLYNPTTGALVVKKTAQTTNGSGVMTLADPLIAAATQYRVVIVLGSGAEGMDKLTAA